MDLLIDLLIRLLTGLFGQPPTLPKGPGFPTLPLPPRPPNPQAAPPRPRPPIQPGQARPPTPAQQQAMRRAAAKPQRAPAPKPAPPPPRAKAAPQAAMTTTTMQRPTSEVDAAALRRWLRPQVLHNQFILSEIFQPPLALRDSALRDPMR
jgi:hypothetical protein